MSPLPPDVGSYTLAILAAGAMCVIAALIVLPIARGRVVPVSAAA